MCAFRTVSKSFHVQSNAALAGADRLLAGVIAGSGTIVAALTVGNDAGRYWLGGHVAYALDRQGDWTLTDVMGADAASQFVASPDEVLAFGYVDAVYWLRFDVVTSLAATAPWWLEIGGLGRSIDEIDVYMTDGHQPASHFQAGDSRPFDIRQVKHHALLFPLKLQPGEPQTVYLRVKSMAHCRFRCGSGRMPIISSRSIMMSCWKACSTAPC